MVKPGQLLVDRYRIDRVLRRGGMAVVFGAFDTRLARTVAVKVLHLDDPSARPRFDQEVQLLAALDHPGLVRVYDAGEDDDDAFYVMELIDGPSLDERLTAGPLSVAHTRAIGAEVAAALAFIHDRGIVHRDVKPSNILLAPDGKVRLADFGIARLLDAARLTTSGLIVGTAAYLAPEQLTGQPVGPPADVYALALVLHECMTGEPAVAGTVEEIAARRLAGHSPVAAAADPMTTGLLTAMLAADPVVRPSASTVATTLTAIGAGATPTPPPHHRAEAAATAPRPGPPDIADRRRVSRVLVVAAAVLAVLVAVLAVAVLTSGPGGRAAASGPSGRVPTTVARPTSTAPPSTASPTTVPPTTTSPTTTPPTTTSPPTFAEAQNQLVQTITADRQDGTIRGNVANHLMHSVDALSQSAGTQDLGDQISTLTDYINSHAGDGGIDPSAAAALTAELQQLGATA